MSSVTEIIVLGPKAGVSADAVVQKVAATVLQQPGVLRLRSSKKIENAEHVVLFIDWEDLSAHKTFMDSPAYPAFAEGVFQLASALTITYHVPFEPFPPTVLENDGGRGKTAVAEVCHAYFPADISLVLQQDALARMNKFIDLTKQTAKGFSGEAACGIVQEELEFKGEKCRALVLVLGWDSVDAHMAFRDTEDFANSIPLMRGMEGLKGMEVFHVCNQVTEK